MFRGLRKNAFGNGFGKIAVDKAVAHGFRAKAGFFLAEAEERYFYEKSVMFY